MPRVFRAASAAAIFASNPSTLQASGSGLGADPGSDRSRPSFRGSTRTACRDHCGTSTAYQVAMENCIDGCRTDGRGKSVDDVGFPDVESHGEYPITRRGKDRREGKYG